MEDFRDFAGVAQEAAQHGVAAIVTSEEGAASLASSNGFRTRHLLASNNSED